MTFPFEVPCRLTVEAKTPEEALALSQQLVEALLRLADYENDESRELRALVSLAVADHAQPVLCEDEDREFDHDTMPPMYDVADLAKLWPDWR